jgi:transposase
MCHHCLHIHPVKGKSYRSGKTFRCGHCGWHGDADFNGANNIALVGLFINQPGGTGLSCKLFAELFVTFSEKLVKVTSGLLKTQTSAVRQVWVVYSRTFSSTPSS